MTDLMDLDGENLGEKHQHFNKLVKEAVEKNACDLDKFDIEEDDIKNLLKIEVASKRRNVEYILNVLACEDILYVSRAIKKCPWLITDVEYSIIINPEYLHNTLFPQMNTKSINKLTKYIQLNLKDSVRVEQFYEYEGRPEKGVKWLPHCSSEFILRNVAKHVNHLKISQIKRLCEKSIMVLELVIDTRKRALPDHSKTKIFQAAACLLKSDNIHNYLDLVEKYYIYPKFGKSATTLIMKIAPERILDKFRNYCYHIHLPTFIKLLNSNDIKSFLIEQASRAENEIPVGIFNIKQLKRFFVSMPNEERFDFIKHIFIDKAHTQETNVLTDLEKKAMNYIYNYVTNTRSLDILELYEHAPFEIALAHIKKVIIQEPQSLHKKDLFSTLLKAAKQNDQNIYTVLQYFRDKQFLVRDGLRYQFIKNIISQTNFHKFNQASWYIVEDIMMVDIIKPDKRIQIFLEAIVIYKVLHSQSVPEIIEKKFAFNTLKTYKNKLDEKNKVKLSNYLYNLIKTKLERHQLKTQQEFIETVILLKQTLNLLNDWNKDLREYPLVINTIKEVIKAKKLNSWNSELSILYNKNKSWKKLLFEDSFNLCPSRTVLINAIKHDATILSRYKMEAEELCFKEKENITQFLRKIKIYWSQSLTKVWTDVFINKLNSTNNQNVSTRGVCILLNRAELLAMLIKYCPENPKIDYGNINELNLNLQRCFAKSMHIARPQPPPEIILLYTKGDYLKYSLPSLLSIYHNLSESKSERYISQMLSTQVSLQKHAIRFAFIKVKPHEKLNIFAKIWKRSNNSTIRSILFKSVHDLLCKEKDFVEMETLWNLLEMFIDNLTFNENKNIYDTLLKVKEVPMAVRAKFYVKSYKFLKSLTASKSEYENYSVDLKCTLFPYAREIMDFLPPSFIVNELLEFINCDFNKDSSTKFSHMRVLTSYLLTATDEQTQMCKYEEIFIPIIKQCSNFFEENIRNQSTKNFGLLLKQLRDDVERFYFHKKMILPVKLFSTIEDELRKMLSESENYLVLTRWALTVIFTENLNGHQSNNWDELCLAAAPQFGNLCYQYLQEHCRKYFPRIFILFTNALNEILSSFMPSILSASRWQIYESLLHNKEFVQGYLTVLYMIRSNQFLLSNEKAEKVLLLITQHPSLEVKMHFNCEHRSWY